MKEMIRFDFECMAHGIACDHKKKVRCRCSVEAENMKEAKALARNVMKRECNHALPSASGWQRTNIFQPDLFDTPSPDQDGCADDDDSDCADDGPDQGDIG